MSPKASIAIDLQSISRSCIFRPKFHDNQGIDSVVVFAVRMGEKTSKQFIMLRIQNKEWANDFKSDDLDTWRKNRQRLDNTDFFCDPRFQSTFEVVDVLFSVKPVSPSLLKGGEAAMVLDTMRCWCPTVARCTVAAQKLLLIAQSTRP